MRLIDRRAEQALQNLLDRARGGMGGVLVLRGEPGVGKSALLDHAVKLAAELPPVSRTPGVRWPTASRKDVVYACPTSRRVPVTG
jgi:hypothetical protein